MRYDANPRQMLLDLYTRGVHKIDWQKIFTIFQDFFATNMSDHAGEKGRVCSGSGFDKVRLTDVPSPPEENMTRKTIFWPRSQNSRPNNSVLSKNSQSAHTGNLAAKTLKEMLEGETNATLSINSAQNLFMVGLWRCGKSALWIKRAVLESA